MSRPMAIGLVVLVLILTSQNEWRQVFNGADSSLPSPSSSSPDASKLQLQQKQQQQHQIPTKRQVAKELIILSQEKQIFGLKELVKTLQQQLGECHRSLVGNLTEVSDNPAL